MKNEINGFDQAKAVDLRLKSDDLLVLRWMVDFSASPKMTKTLVGGKVYYWINYQAVLNDLPILSVSKQQLRKKIFPNLVAAGILEHRTIRKKGNKGGVYSSFAFGVNYDSLIRKDADQRDTIGRKAPNPMVENYPTKTFRINDLSFKKDNKTPEQEICSGENVVSDEIDVFVDETYPKLYSEYYCTKHPSLTPVQRNRTKQILRQFSEQYVVSTEELEEAAEEFLRREISDGNIKAFANRKMLYFMLVSTLRTDLTAYC